MMTVQENYNSWLQMFADDAALVKELTDISGNQPELEDRFYCDLSFGTAGMRGVLGYGTNRMNVYTVRRATQGLADSLDEKSKKRGVVIGYDSRRMSSEFALETALVLCANQVKAYLFDALRPVALLSYGVRHLNAAAGVVITASHNPPQYNGYKVYGEDGAQLGPEAAAMVTEKIQKLQYNEAKRITKEEALQSGLLKIISNADVDDAYMEMVHTLSINPAICREQGHDFKIVYTPIHGSGNVPVRRILNEIGLTNVSVVKEQELPDPNFSTVRVPNPEDPAAFTLAKELANQVSADAIFGTDPDCDRLGVAVRQRDGSFCQLTGNQIGCLMLYYILSCKKQQGTLPANGAVVKSIVSTELARAICNDFGVTLFETLTGFKFIGEKIQQFEDSGEYTYLFGFEESYGYLSGTAVRDKDGVNASMLIAEAACYYHAQGKTLSDIMDEIFERYGFYLEKVDSKTLPGKDGLKVMADIMTRIRNNPPAAIAGISVLRVLDILAGTETDVKTGNQRKLDYPSSDVLYFALEGGHFVCIRPSGTEPKIKLYVNVNNKQKEIAESLLQNLFDSANNLMA